MASSDQELSTRSSGDDVMEPSEAQTGTWLGTRRLRRQSVSPKLGWPIYTIRRILLLGVCILAVVQYGMVLVWGVIQDDLVKYYGLTSKEGASLYTWENFGACALSFIPGVCYDRFGPAISMVLGTILGVIPICFQMVWSPTFPEDMSTMQGLSTCYVFFGLSASFYNVIGCLAPVVAFEDKHVGKVSAIVQVCLSLGLTVQSAAYSALKARGGDFIEAYLIYVLVCTTVSGILLTVVLWVCRPLFQPKGHTHIQTNDRPLVADLNDSEAAQMLNEQILHEPRSLWSLICSVEFLYMSAFFLVVIGFCFSFLAVPLSGEVDASASDLDMQFGVLNAVGRVMVSLPLDYTKGHPLGGIHTYIITSLVVFFCGLLFLVVPTAPDTMDVQVANGIIALGYGGMMGVIPLALREFFGTDHLGILYGALYFWVYFSIYFWSEFSQKPTDCQGVACYRPYCLGGTCSTMVIIALGCFMLAREVSQKRSARLGAISHAPSVTTLGGLSMPGCASVRSGSP